MHLFVLSYQIPSFIFICSQCYFRHVPACVRPYHQWDHS